VNHFLGIIPARYASTRFPGKPLALLGNKPMIQWVFERASAVLPHVVVATDDIRIKEVVEGFGGEAVMTSSNHHTGTERCAEALDLFQKKHPEEFTHVINIQGDEPLLKQDHLLSLMEGFQEPATQIATLIQVKQHPEDLNNPNVVKVVVDKHFRALYFSRSPLPFIRLTPGQETPADHIFYTHIGLYAFKAELLRALIQLPASPLEEAESLEQLRWLENAYSIQTVVTKHAAMGVDTPEDLEKIAGLL
jgi:3-deoxy-manno-octulosonate cytidylyltransferase (CMP-KDO synthetase)